MKKYFLFHGSKPLIEFAIHFMISVAVSIICYGVILGNATYSGTELSCVRSTGARASLRRTLCRGAAGLKLLRSTKRAERHSSRAETRIFLHQMRIECIYSRMRSL